jgi:hypothetical protein
MSSWTAVSMVVVTTALIGVVAVSRLISDAVRDLAQELHRLRSLRYEADGLLAELRDLDARRARGDHGRR